MYKKNDFFVWFFIFCLFVFVFITFKASPPHPQKVHFYQLIFFLISHTFIKTLRYSLWNVCSVLCAPGRRPCPPSPARPPQSPRHLVSGPGRGRGEPGYEDPWPRPPGSPGSGTGVSRAPSSSWPCPPTPPCKSKYLVRASLNSEVMAPGAPEPPGPDPSCASRPSRKAASSA